MESTFSTTDQAVPIGSQRSVGHERNMSVPAGDILRKRPQSNIDDGLEPGKRPRNIQVACDEAVDSNDPQQMLNVSNAQVLKLSKQFAEASKINNGLAQEIIRLNHDNAALQGQIYAEKRVSSELSLRLDEEAKSVTVQIDELRRKIDALNQENGVLKANLDQEKQRVADQTAELKESLAQSQREKKAAEEKFEQAAKQRNQLVEDLSDLIPEKHANKRHEDALELWFKALSIEEMGRKDPNRLGKFWNYISVCWYELEKYGKALGSAEKAIQYTPRNADYFFNRGRAHKDLGNRKKAISDFEKAIEFNPNHELAKAALTRFHRM